MREFAEVVVLMTKAFAILFNGLDETHYINRFRVVRLGNAFALPDSQPRQIGAEFPDIDAAEL